MDQQRWNLISEKMREAILKAVQDTGRKIFDESQSNILDDSYLKSTGNFALNNNGWEIEYSDLEAESKEFGSPEQKIHGVQTHLVNSYVRKGYTRKKDGVFIKPTVVKSHFVTLEDKKIISIQTPSGKEFRTVSKINEKKGKFFLTNAIEEKIIDLPNDLKKRIEEIKL